MDRLAGVEVEGAEEPPCITSSKLADTAGAQRAAVQHPAADAPGTTGADHPSSRSHHALALGLDLLSCSWSLR
uniref:Uncharacterized protein n=1 Tax=Oryza sativa subsp. japonica TaxID=39947 RepID=Q6K7P3_ORYSJ|nr:hypothetical protein [Oryza sativa Japonica Group]